VPPFGHTVAASLQKMSYGLLLEYFIIILMNLKIEKIAALIHVSFEPLYKLVPYLLALRGITFTSAKQSSANLS